MINLTHLEIRTTRLYLGLSYRQFAKLLGMNGENAQDNIRKFETGKKVPSEKTIKRIQELSCPK